MNRDKNGFVIFDDDFRREMMTPKQFALSNKHSEEFKKLLAKRDSGEISEQEYNKFTEKLDCKHESEYEKLYAEEHKEKISSNVDFNSMAVANF